MKTDFHGGEILDLILVERISKVLNEVMYWDGVELSIAEIRQRINDENIIEIEEPFPNSICEYRLNRKFNKEWHIGRIKYFVNHPEKITPIDVDNYCVGNYISGEPIIIDGHHRLIAAMIRGDEKIPAHYSGLVSTLDWLTGAKDDFDPEC